MTLNLKELNDFISRYYLGGIVNDIWLESNQYLSCKFHSDASLLGLIESKTISLDEKGEFGILGTDEFVKLLSVMKPTTDFNLVESEWDKDSFSGIKMEDDRGVSSYYMTAEKVAIASKHQGLKQKPSFDYEIKLTDDFVDTFRKAKSALKKERRFTFIDDKKGSRFVLGHSKTNDTNVKIPVSTTGSGMMPVTFNADYVDAILAANGYGGVLKLNQDICCFEWDEENISTQYYIKAMDTDSDED